jgi:hypothetical protein
MVHTLTLAIVCGLDRYAMSWGVVVVCKGYGCVLWGDEVSRAVWVQQRGGSKGTTCALLALMLGTFAMEFSKALTSTA